MRLEVFPDAQSTAQAAARFLAQLIAAAVAERGRCVMACSGGSGPWPMFRSLAREPVAWPHVHVVQVDERLVALQDDERNWKRIRANLIEPAGVLAAHAHPMPVEEGDVSEAAMRYAAELESIAGKPAIIDIVHLGIGSDGHTASLVPGDGVLDVKDRDVAVTRAAYQGHRRMTMTFPILDRARCRLWLVCGEGKAEALARLLRGDASVPAGRVNRAGSVVFADEAAASAGVR